VTGDLISTITFEENGPGGFTNHGTNAVFGGVTFAATSPTLPMTLYTVDPGFSSGYDLGSGDVLSAQSAGSGNSISLDISALNTKALSFDWLHWDTGALSISLSTGDTFNVPTVAFGPGFFGVTSTIPIVGLSISNLNPCGGCVINIDNFAFTTAATESDVVPEPASLTLLGAGLAGLAGLFARRRRSGSQRKKA
jgi:hypothetical protein